MKGFVKDRFAMQASLASFHDRVAWIVAETCHQGDRNIVEDLLESEHQLIARIVRQFDIGDDHIVFLFGTSDHRYGLIATLCRLDNAAVAFEQGVSIIADALVEVDYEYSATFELGVMLAEFLIG